MMQRMFASIVHTGNMIAKSTVLTAKVANEKKAEKTYLANLVGRRRLALVRGSVVEPSVEPADLVHSCKRLFDSKGNQKVLAKIQDLLDDYDALSEYAPAHTESICKYGVIWKDPQVPEKLTDVACFPEGEQVNKMLCQAEDMNNAAHYEQ
jgi:hypothetical protein